MLFRSGFPGETEEDFSETLDVVQTCKYDGAFTFIFSPREGTPASLMKDDVSFKEKETRLKRLNDIVNFHSNENNQKYVGEIVPVLVQGVNEKDSNKVYGYTETMKLVNVEADKETIGQIINVRITEAKSFSMNGEVIS